MAIEHQTQRHHSAKAAQPNKVTETRMASYSRVSSAEQVKGVSIENQMERLRNYAKFREWTLSEEFVDVGWSGKDDNRPGLRRLIATARQGRLSAVAVTKIGRLMRNTRLLLQHVDEFKKLGVRFIAIDDNIDTGEAKTGQLMLTILAGVAQWERERLGLVFTDGAITREAYEKKLHELVGMENELLRVRDNLSPEARFEIEDLENAIASLEKTLNGKTGRVLLTELGVMAMDFPKEWIAGHTVTYSFPIETESGGVYAAVQPDDVLRIEDLGIEMKIVDGPEVSSSVEVPRDTIWRNIRDIFDTFGIKVYIFLDRVEIRGYIPTEVIDVSRGAERRKSWAIIGSARG